MSVCPSTRSFFNFNDIWHVDRGQRVMHDGMQYDPIQGQGHKHLKVGTPSIFKRYNNIYNNNNQDDIYGAVIMAKPLREFI